VRLKDRETQETMCLVVNQNGHKKIRNMRWWEERRIWDI